MELIHLFHWGEPERAPHQLVVTVHCTSIACPKFYGDNTESPTLVVVVYVVLASRMPENLQYRNGKPHILFIYLFIKTLQLKCWRSIGHQVLWPAKDVKVGQNVWKVADRRKNPRQSQTCRHPIYMLRNTWTIWHPVLPLIPEKSDLKEMRAWALRWMDSSGEGLCLHHSSARRTTNDTTACYVAWD